MLTYGNAGEDIRSLLEKDWLEQEDIQTLARLLPDCDSDLRQQIAEQLINAEPEEAWPLLRTLAGDEDWLVRAEACQSLSVNHSAEALELLEQACRHEEDEVVRAYAIHSLGAAIQAGEDVARVTAMLEELKRSEREPRVRMATLEALYHAEPRRAYLEEIMGYLHSDDYTLRCTALNTLSELASPENRVTIRERLTLCKAEEKAPAVLSTIERLEGELEEWDKVNA